MTGNFNKRAYFEIIASSIYGLLIISLFIFKLIDIKKYLQLTTFLTLGIIVILLFYFAYSAKSTPFTVTITLSSIVFIGMIFEILHVTGHSFIMKVGMLFSVLTTLILSILILKKYLTSPSKNKLHLLLFKILTIYLLAKIVLLPILKFFTFNIDYLFSLPVIFLLSFLIIQDDFPTYQASIKNGLKTILLLHVTMFCLQLITRTTENYSRQQHLQEIGGTEVRRHICSYWEFGFPQLYSC